MKWKECPWVLNYNSMKPPDCQLGLSMKGNPPSFDFRSCLKEECPIVKLFVKVEVSSVLLDGVKNKIQTMNDKGGEVYELYGITTVHDRDMSELEDRIKALEKRLNLLEV